MMKSGSNQFAKYQDDMMKIFTAAAFTLLLSSNPVTAENWYVGDWYGSGSEGLCLIGTSDDQENRQIYFGFADGRQSYNEYSFNPSGSISIKNIVPPTSSNTLFEVKISFDQSVGIETTMRSSFIQGEADLSYISISRNKVTDYFQSETLNHENLVNFMKISNQMTITNNRGDTLANFSLIGFTNIFEKYSSCIKDLNP